MGRRNVRQRQIAELLNLSQASVSAKLAGKTPFIISELAIISSWFDITLGELLGSGVLNAKNPRLHKEDGDPAYKLPHLDLNQEPFDYWSEMGARSYLLAYTLILVAAHTLSASGELPGLELGR